MLTTIQAAIDRRPLSTAHHPNHTDIVLFPQYQDADGQDAHAQHSYGSEEGHRLDEFRRPGDAGQGVGLGAGGVDEVPGQKHQSEGV